MARTTTNKNRAAAEERTAAAERGTSGGLKKGPWTAAEDAILTEYVKKRGEGNWNAVQKNAGLSRCGKSCRLRWANHLRPNLKKGAFSPDEERIIIELHAKLGNKWARMASQLPGRTDNEIKNYWNTRMKRRQRAGLPIYPHELHQQPQVQELHQITQNPHSSSSNSFSSLLSQNKPNIALYNNYSHHPTNINQLGNFAMPINSHVSHFSPNVTTTLPIIPSFQYNPGGTFGTFSSMLTGPPYNPLGRLLATELPSTQTPASSDATSGEVDQGLVGRAEISSSITAHDESYDFMSHGSGSGNSGLLDDLLVEARTLSRNDRVKQQNNVSYGEEEKGKCVAQPAESEEEDENGVRSESVLKNSGETCTGDDEYRTDNFSSCEQSSIGIEPSEDPLDVSSMDDDLMSLLNNFPTLTPFPDWYPGEGGGEISNIETYAATSGIARHDVVVPQNASRPTRVSKQDKSFNSFYWNNMPGIC